MCQACRDLPLATPNVPPHPDLAYRGFHLPTRKERGIEREEHYCCQVCRTRWVKEIDRWGTDLGFRLGA